MFSLYTNLTHKKIKNDYRLNQVCKRLNLEIRLIAITNVNMKERNQFEKHLRRSISFYKKGLYKYDTNDSTRRKLQENGKIHLLIYV